MLTISDIDYIFIYIRYNKDIIMIDRDEKELLETYRKMIGVTRSNMLAYIRIACISQENTKEDIRRQYGLSPDGYPAQAGQTAAAQPERTGV